MKRLAVFGGTFNPIHVGHLMAAEDIRQLFGLDRVIFVSSSVPPHKESAGITPPEHRYRMVRLAVEGNPYFNASSVELDREGKSYSADTVSYFSRMVGPQATLYFIVGMDAFLDLATWQDVPRLFELCKFIVVTRPGTGFKKSALSFLDDFGTMRCQWFDRKRRLSHPEEALDQIVEDTTKAPGGAQAKDVYLIESVKVDISSSDIRTLVKNGRSIKYLVPERVEEYIFENNLFL